MAGSSGLVVHVAGDRGENVHGAILLESREERGRASRSWTAATRRPGPAAPPAPPPPSVIRSRRDRGAAQTPHADRPGALREYVSVSRARCPERRRSGAPHRAPGPAALGRASRHVVHPDGGRRRDLPARATARHRAPARALAPAARGWAP